MKILKAIFLCLLVLLLGFIGLVFYVSSDPSLARNELPSVSVGDRKVNLFAPGEGTITLKTKADANGMEILLRNRNIAIRSDGKMFVDGQPVQIPDFKELEVSVHSDMRVETRILQGR